MNEDTSTTSAGNGCDAIQRRISDSADSGEPLPADVHAHLAACAGCSVFAAQWLHGTPATLIGNPLPVLRSDELRERILDRNAAPNLVVFPSPSRQVRWSAWAGRIAAGLALVAFSYWLLDPVATPPATARSSGNAGPTLGRDVSRLEDRSRAEREAIAKAVVGGGQQVNESLRWSVSALEL